MNKITFKMGGLALAFLLAASTLSAQESRSSTEQFRYSWRLRGGLAWLAGIKFPTSGNGELINIPSSDGQSLSSELKITPADGEKGFYVYRSEIDPDGERTLTSYHGYAWGSKGRREHTFFDYVKRLARIRKETSTAVETKTKPIPSSTIRDVLTGIHYLRQHADSITQPMRSDVYSDGKLYPVMFRPEGSERLDSKGRRIDTRVFLITAVPGMEKKFPGGVKVWLSNDDRHVPMRIEIQQSSLAYLRLDLRSAE